MSDALQITVETTSRKISVKNPSVLINGDSVPVELTFTTASTDTRQAAGTAIVLGIKADGRFTDSPLASCDTWTRPSSDSEPYMGTLALTGDALNTALANSTVLKAMLEVTWGDGPTTSQIAAVTIKNDVNRPQDPPPTPSATFEQRVEAAMADELAGKSNVGHTHDDRYYTEGEINTALAGKSDTGHNHDTRYYTQTQVDALLSDTAANDPVLLYSTDISSVSAGGAFAIPLTIRAGRRYILEFDGLTYSSVTDYDELFWQNQTPGPGQYANTIMWRMSPEGGRPSRIVFYALNPDGEVHQTADLFVPEAGVSYKMAAEWGLLSGYMILNDEPVYTNLSNNLSAVLNYPADPVGLTHVKLPNAATAQTVRVYERPSIKQIVLLGDSMTQAGAFDSALRVGSNRNRNWINRGVGGRTLEDILAALSADVQPFYQSAATENVVVLRAGVNNLAPNGSASSMLAVVQNIVNTIKGYNSGWKVDLCTITPFNAFFSNGATQASAEAQRQLYNAGLSNITGIRRVIDTGNLPQLQDPNEAAFFVDQLHCTTAGYRLLANCYTARL